MNLKLKKLEPENGQKSGFPKQSGYKAFFNDEVGNYQCFSVQELYQDLFVSDKSGLSLITFQKELHKEKFGESLFYFLLPKEIINKVINGSKAVIKTDFQEFLVKDNKGRKITTLLCQIFSSEEINSEKLFVTQVQKHFINILKSAVFSDELEEYLKCIGDNVIVPKKISPKANSEFHLILKKRDHNSISIIIANFFVSAMIGLHPIQYDTYETVSGSRKRKTYLLNSLGMEFIWTPEQISADYIRQKEIQYYYDKGFYTEAYIKALHRLVEEKEKEAKNIDTYVHSEIYRLLGLCLLRHPEACDISKLDKEIQGKVYQTLNLKHCWPENAVNTIDYILNIREVDGVTCLLKSILLNKENKESHFILFEYYRKKGDEEKSLKSLKIAFDQDYTRAVIEVTFLYLDSNYIFKDITEELMFKKINNIIENEQTNDAVDVGKCLYLQGRFERKYNNEAKAQEYFEEAAKKGNEKAKKELVRKERVTARVVFPSFSSEETAKCCFANTLTGNNYQALSTFPDKEWSLFAPVKTDLNGIQFALNVDKFIEKQHIGTYEFCRPKIVFLFMSDDKKKNLNDCLELLDKLFNSVFNLPDEQKWKLIDNTHIYVNADYETASMLIDANMSQMGDNIYFNIHIADENRDTVHKLLCDAPLFLPALNGAKSENMTKVILFGGSEINYNFVKESIASTYLGENHPINIALLGENADKLEHRFNQECPGILGCPNITCIRPKFVKCNIKEVDFPDCIYGNARDSVFEMKEIEDDSDLLTVARELIDGNYFIVDFADDLENIRFAMELRTWLLRSSKNFDRTPFIAVKISDKQNAYLTKHLTLTGQAAGDSYYNQYDLFPFGISAQTYDYKNIIMDPVLDRIALQIHKFYYLDNEIDRNNVNELKDALKKCKRSAENDYYSYSYNADSSISTAIGLCYRLFVAECILPSKEKYLEFGSLRSMKLLSDFSDYLNDKSIEKLAKIEQTRWNSFMLVRGWLPADKEQIEKYEAQSSGIAHKHILAKLHPFIREWDDLNDSKLFEILDIFKLKANYDKKPQVTTMRSVEDTARFFIRETRENVQEKSR